MRGGERLSITLEASGKRRGQIIYCSKAETARKAFFRVIFMIGDKVRTNNT